jgi:predicted MPP superfamily phosphohydrolase
MTRIVWLTDPHLNFLEWAGIEAFLARVRAKRPDVVLLGGDFGEAPDCAWRLAAMDEAWQIPLYFVLGNHDYYRGSIAHVRQQVAELCRERPRLVHLNASDPIELAPGVGLIGHDGWADGRVGDYERSMVMMNDYRLIRELAGVNKRDRLPLLRQLAEEAADHIRRVLPQALDRFSTTFLVTHAPPFREACWHEGGHSDDEWAPHFVCQALGEAIVEVMSQRTDRKLIVLCGHTHSSGEYSPLPNVLVLTAGAQYGAPGIAGIFEAGATA